jgi:hypothetical protein
MTANFFFVHVLFRVKISDFAGNPYGMLRSIKGADRSDAAFALFQTIGKILYTNADWGNCSEPGDKNAFHLIWSS